MDIPKFLYTRFFRAYKRTEKALFGILVKIRFAFSGYDMFESREKSLLERIVRGFGLDKLGKGEKMGAYSQRDGTFEERSLSGGSPALRIPRGKDSCVICFWEFEREEDRGWIMNEKGERFDFCLSCMLRYVLTPENERPI